MKQLIEYFTQYSHKADKFCFVPEENLTKYLRLGLIGETGEVCDKLKKVLRDSDTDTISFDDPLTWPHDVRHAIILELGDVMWYVAETFRHRDLAFLPYNESTEGFYDTIKSVVVNVDDIFSLAVMLFDIVNKTIITDDPEHAASYIVGIISIVDEMSFALGYPFLQTLNENIEKLQSRADRNKLSGSGDNR